MRIDLAHATVPGSWTSDRPPARAAQPGRVEVCWPDEAQRQLLAQLLDRDRLDGPSGDLDD